MVFRIKAELTEEDRRAWQRVAACRARSFRRGYGFLMLLWLAMKILGLSLLVLVSVMLALLSGSDTWLVIKLCGMVDAAVFVYFGIGLLRLFFRPPKRPDGPPAWDFPPDKLSETPVRAAFFGDGCFAFRASGEKIRLGYSTITGAWEDGGRFYLFFADRPPLVLPKRGLGRWMPEDFRDFLERELEVPVERMK